MLTSAPPEQSQQIMSSHTSMKASSTRRSRRRGRTNKESNESDTTIDGGTNKADHSTTLSSKIQTTAKKTKSKVHHRRRRDERRSKKSDAQETSISKGDIPNTYICVAENVRTNEIELNEHSFPSLTSEGGSETVESAADTAASTTSTSWTVSLTNKIAILELEALRRQQFIKQEQSLALLKSNDVSLTMLSSRHARDVEDMETNYHEHSVDRDHDQLSTELESENTLNSTMLPNARLKWSDSQLMKMRQRWWEALRAKRQHDEERRRQMNNNYKTAVESYVEDELHEGSSSSSSSSSSSVILSSSSSSGDMVEHYNDSMQPPSLKNTPFDEISISSEINSSSKTLALHHTLPIPKSILDLEQMCLESPHPFHFLIQQYAIASASRDVISISDAASDAVAVLQRLLTIHDENEVAEWRAQRIDPKDMDGEVAAVIPDLSKLHSEELLSADITSLTPLQLAILWDLPKLVRIMLSVQSITSTTDGNRNKCEESDEHNRTPLMMACELGNLACMDTILCLSNIKFDARELQSGNTAYHFCCMRKPKFTEPPPYKHNVDDYHEGNVHSSTDAFELLLSKSPYGMQKRVLMMVNNDKRNLLHTACSHRDLRLVECLLEHLSCRGYNLAVKALNMKDRYKCVPFLTAVMSDATDVAMHLLVSRFATGSNFTSWFTGSPLTIASSNNSVEMIQLLLGIGDHVAYDLNRALLESMRRRISEMSDLVGMFGCGGDGDGSPEHTYEIIRLLIENGANPHLPVAVDSTNDKPLTKGDRVLMQEYLKGRVKKEDIPFTAAARTGDETAVRTMLDCYNAALEASRLSRRNDPLLRTQPESYFTTLEEREDEIVQSSMEVSWPTHTSTIPLSYPV